MMTCLSSASSRVFLVAPPDQVIDEQIQLFDGHTDTRVEKKEREVFVLDKV
jgi:hypothetical protein